MYSILPDYLKPDTKHVQCEHIPIYFNLPYFADAEWTAWFPYTITNQQKIPLNPATSLLRHLRIYRSADVCDKILDTDTRVVNGFYQVRYKCPPGAIKGTDFPPVDSQEGKTKNYMVRRFGRKQTS